MNIACKGDFLREGFIENGHKVFELDVKNGGNLASCLQALPESIDLVVWEFFGGFSDLKTFSHCETPVAAYCVDTPLNEFWLTPCLKNLDYVFTDQPQCVSTLAAAGIEASWLPLPAKNSWFQLRREKNYDITFIGTVSEHRKKRKNLLNLLKSRFKINMMSGLDVNASQKIFSESRIIINENFFPGLTMRVLQGLSAGTLVFTEESPYGDRFGLENGKDLIFYNPDNAPDRLAELLNNYDRFSEIAVNGQNKCRALFSAGHVANDFLAKITGSGLARREREAEDWQWNQTVAEVLYGQRFGGNFTVPMKRLKAIAASSSKNAGKAHAMIGDIQTRFKGGQSALEHYRASLDMEPSGSAALKLALLYIQRKEPDAARKFVRAWLRNSATRFSEKISGISESESDPGQALLALVCEIYFALGRRFDMGFHKDFKDPVPDTAYDTALLAWNLSPSAWALDMMLRCLRPYYIEGEILPFMLAGMKAGILTDYQKLEAARISYKYYDRETAGRLLASR